MAELFKMKLLDVNKNQILPETSADQVTMAGGGNVEAKIKSLESAFAAGTRLLGTVGTEGTVETLPADSYQLGDMYVVKTAGTYASQVCEPGDLILCVKAYAEEGAADRLDRDPEQRGARRQRPGKRHGRQPDGVRRRVRHRGQGQLPQDGRRQ